MDRRRAAGALLALAACIASSAAAPTTSNQTALDLYEETTEGCYYNFQHYGEGDRIMTNEPCLNCTCHNRMLMCYLRVCPFTKAIGQDCTVEKRADQCCPIVTCPDVPVDLLTSTSTSSPAEFGGTGVGKVDKYGCSINGKYFSEGAKVPPTPGKPCEHCYCIRNMTTCVMQECTLHVDGCTPIYHKDVCCPVRYYCDHPEDEIPLLDDMTTTVRPTPGFLLTTMAPTEIPTTAPPARRDCTEDDQLYPDGALIKTDKPCEHCYCMKGDIVCVVQECGTPMENEGKNCTSLPPREGQCCPDTYICEGDEISTELPVTESVTTIAPPRRASVEGSGYRNEPDEILYTESPTFATEIEGSGEEELTVKPEKESTDKDLIDKFGPTEEFIPMATQVPTLEHTGSYTTEPDKGLNTVPSGMLDEEGPESTLETKTSPKIPLTDSEYNIIDETTTSLPSEKEKSSEPSLETTTPIYETKVTEPSIADETTGSIIDTEKEIIKPIEKETTPKEKDQTESSVSEEPVTHITVKPEDYPASTKEPTDTVTDKFIDSERTPSVTASEKTPETLSATVIPTIVDEERRTTVSPLETEKDEGETTVSPPTNEDEEILSPDNKKHTTVSAPIEDEVHPPVDELKTTVLPPMEESETLSPDSRRTTLNLNIETTPPTEDKTASISEHTIAYDKLETMKPEIIEQNITPVSTEQDQGTDLPTLEMTTMHEETKKTQLPETTEHGDISAKPAEHEISEQSGVDLTTTSRNIVDVSEMVPTTVIPKEELPIITTESIIMEDEKIDYTESNTEQYTEGPTGVAKETVEPTDKEISTERDTTQHEQKEHEDTDMQSTTVQILDKQEEKETTTETIMELSTFAHISEKEATTLNPVNAVVTTGTAPEQNALPQSTTVNPAENEIAQVPSPGRIPGEGDCLLEGTTYQNDSIVPSTNKCHSGCKCISSIIKCDPIICSSPPEDVDNCQPRYDTPEACCPTYVCDHVMETMPPQSQSHITGTDSPTPSTMCEGVDCERYDDKQPIKPVVSDKTDNDCGSSGCDQITQSPKLPCSGNQCKDLQPPIELEKPQEIPVIDTTKPCANPDDCKEIKLPESCKDGSCADSPSLPCDKESRCGMESDEVPGQETPQICSSEEECKQVKIPQPELVPCEGECTNVQEDCSTGECKINTVPGLGQPQDEECSKENGCTKPDKAVECEDGKCIQHEVNKTENVCSGDTCIQQQPATQPDETTPTAPITDDQITSKQPTPEQEIDLASPGSSTIVSEETYTVKPTLSSETNKESKEPESPVSDEEDRVTKLPDEIISSLMTELPSVQPVHETTDMDNKDTELTPDENVPSNEPITEIPKELTTSVIRKDETVILVSSATDEPPQNEIEPTEEKTKLPEVTTESYDKRTDKPEESIVTDNEVPKQQYDDTKPTISETVKPLAEESTKEPEKEDGEQDITTVSPSSTTESDQETINKFNKPDEISTRPMPEIVTVSLSEETTLLPERDESGIKATETTIQVSHEAEHPEISTSSEELVTKLDLPTEAPDFVETEITTPSKKEEFVNTDSVTERQEDATKVPEEDADKNTVIPAYSDSLDQTTMKISDTTDVVPAHTKLPELEVKHTTTEISMKPSALDVSVKPMLEQEIPEHPIITTETPEQLDTATSVSGPASVEEKVTTITEVTSFEKETESSLPHVTASSRPDTTFASMTTEINDISKSSASPSKDEEYEGTTYTPAPEIDTVNEDTSLTGTDKIEAPPQVTSEGKITTESATEQEQMTEKPIPDVTETAKPPIVDHQPSVKPPTLDSDNVKDQEPVTIDSVRETTEALEETTKLLLEPTTESQESIISQEKETSTETPPIQENEVKDVEPDKDLTEISKEPEHYVTVPTYTDKPTENLKEVEKDISEMPTLDVKEETTAPITESQYPVTITDSQKVTEQTPEKEVTTEIPISDEEKSQTSGEYITKQTITESPETTVAPEVVHYETTIVQGEPQLSTEKPAEKDVITVIPELQTTKQHEIEKEGSPFTSAPEEPVIEDKTESPEVQQTTGFTQSGSVNTELGETSTTSPKIEVMEHEELHTEQPISLTTDSKLYTTTEPKDESTKGQQQENVQEIEEKPTESLSEEATKPSIDMSTAKPVSDEEKKPEEPEQTSRPEVEYSETTPYLVELEEHTHKTDEIEPTIIPSEEPTVVSSEEPSITSLEESAATPSGETTNIPLVETTITLSEEPTFVPSEKPTAIPSERLTTAASEELTIVPSKEPTTIQSEESTTATIHESTASVSLTERPIPVLSGEEIISSSEEPNVSISEEQTTVPSYTSATEKHITERVTEKLASEEIHTVLPEKETELPSDVNKLVPSSTEEPHTMLSTEEIPEKSTEEVVPVETTSETVKPTDELLDKYGSEDSKKETTSTTLRPDVMDELTSPPTESEKPASSEEVDKVTTPKPQFVPAETTAPEEEFIPVTTKLTTAKPEEQTPTETETHGKPEDKPNDPASTALPEIAKPDEMHPIDEVPSPEDEPHFPPSGGYNQEPDYVEEDQAFGPGTCRYGGKVYVSAQQIPRDDPCDFCFCFRSDIICLQQSCPPPIHGCHEEPIQGFCCPRYECPVSMATSLNVTTTTTTTTTTLPPHFLPHAYKGAATKKGCQIKGHTYQVGEVVRASSGPCLHCTCGGDGQMKCDPKQCTPEPMLRQMIAAAVSAKRRR